MLFAISQLSEDSFSSDFGAERKVYFEDVMESVWTGHTVLDASVCVCYMHVKDADSNRTSKQSKEFEEKSYDIEINNISH